MNATITVFTSDTYINSPGTGFYYVSSRYYDPGVGRFISPELNVDCGVFDEGAGLLGYNVYAYCANNPVMYMDETGESISLVACVVTGVLAGGTIGAVASKMYYGKVNGWWVLGGAVVGGVIGYVGGAFFGASGIKAGTLASKIKMSRIRQLGKIVGKLSSIPKNKTPIDSITKSKKYRIPDFLSKEYKLIGEVKNVKQLSYTKQLKDYMLYAEREGYTFFLQIRKTTKLSSTLKKW